MDSFFTCHLDHSFLEQILVYSHDDPHTTHSLYWCPDSVQHLGENIRCVLLLFVEETGMCIRDQEKNILFVLATTALPRAIVKDQTWDISVEACALPTVLAGQPVTD